MLSRHKRDSKFTGAVSWHLESIGQIFGFFPLTHGEHQSLCCRDGSAACRDRSCLMVTMVCLYICIYIYVCVNETYVSLCINIYTRTIYVCIHVRTCSFWPSLIEMGWNFVGPPTGGSCGNWKDGTWASWSCWQDAQWWLGDEPTLGEMDPSLWHHDSYSSPQVGKNWDPELTFGSFAFRFENHENPRLQSFISMFTW